jgi:putative spermidine/putrescine transport system permease protein
MGAFTSAALLGGGRVLTVPVLIQRTLLIETKYGMTAALSVVLLASVMLVNLISAVLAARLHRGTAHAR